MKKPRFLLTLSLFTLINLNALAEDSLKEFNQLFKNGNYSKAIAAINKVKNEELPAGQKYYLTGLSYSKLQEYDNAITNFEQAIKEQNANVDIYYEYGQALYAANELKKARSAFNKSIEKKYNVPACTYYVAHISQILEEYTLAKDNYTALIKNKDTDAKMKQIARFQLGETLLSLAREKAKSPAEISQGVEKYIIPMLKQAHATDKGSAVAAEILARIQELQKEFDLDPDLLRNGRRISPKRYSGYITQKVKFDDNISLTNEENNVSQSQRESYIFESEAYAKYDFVIKKRFIVSPDVRVNFIDHSESNAPEVFQNDAFSMYFNLRNRYEHIVRNQPAAFIFDLELAKINKDWRQEKQRTAYARSLNFIVGESFNYFTFGDTSIKLKRKAYRGENDSISNNTTALSVDQTAFLPIQHLLIGLFEMNLVDNYNNPSTNTNSYLFRFDYLIPEIMPKYTLGLAFSTTITDTLDQKDSRGMETTLNPSVDLSKEIRQNLKLSVNLDYTKNKSKHASYAYKKSVFSTELRYSF